MDTNERNAQIAIMPGIGYRVGIYIDYSTDDLYNFHWLMEGDVIKWFESYEKALEAGLYYGLTQINTTLDENIGD